MVDIPRKKEEINRKGNFMKIQHLVIAAEEGIPAKTRRGRKTAKSTKIGYK